MSRTSRPYGNCGTLLPFVLVSLLFPDQAAPPLEDKDSPNDSKCLDFPLVGAKMNKTLTVAVLRGGPVVWDGTCQRFGADEMEVKHRLHKACLITGWSVTELEELEKELEQRARDSKTKRNVEGGVEEASPAPFAEPEPNEELTQEQNLQIYEEYLRENEKKIPAATLVKWCQGHHLSTSGTKSALIERLISFKRFRCNAGLSDTIEKLIARPTGYSRTEANRWGQMVIQNHKNYFNGTDVITRYLYFLMSLFGVRSPDACRVHSVWLIITLRVLLMERERTMLHARQVSKLPLHDLLVRLLQELQGLRELYTIEELWKKQPTGVNLRAPIPSPQASARPVATRPPEPRGVPHSPSDAVSVADTTSAVLDLSTVADPQPVPKRKEHPSKPRLAKKSKPEPIDLDAVPDPPPNPSQKVKRMTLPVKINSKTTRSELERICDNFDVDLGSLSGRIVRSLLMPNEFVICDILDHYATILEGLQDKVLFLHSQGHFQGPAGRDSSSAYVRPDLLDIVCRDRRRRAVSRDVWFFPMLQNAHFWSIIIDFAAKTVDFYCSLGVDRQEQCREFLELVSPTLRLHKPDPSSFPIRRLCGPRQVEVECGLFTLMAMCSYAKDLPITPDRWPSSRAWTTQARVDGAKELVVHANVSTDLEMFARPSADMPVLLASRLKARPDLIPSYSLMNHLKGSEI